MNHVKQLFWPDFEWFIQREWHHRKNITFLPNEPHFLRNSNICFQTKQDFFFFFFFLIFARNPRTKRTEKLKKKQKKKPNKQTKKKIQKKSLNWDTKITHFAQRISWRATTLHPPPPTFWPENEHSEFRTSDLFIQEKFLLLSRKLGIFERNLLSAQSCTGEKFFGRA